MKTFQHQNLVVLRRSEVSLESLFEDPNPFLLDFDSDSVCLYISGCPAIHLFEMIISRIKLDDYPGLLTKLWNVLYVDAWEDDNVLITHGESKVRLYALYNQWGMYSLDLIRHCVPSPQGNGGGARLPFAPLDEVCASGKVVLHLESFPHILAVSP